MSSRRVKYQAFVDEHFTKEKALGVKIKFLRCNTAGEEHLKELKKVCEKHGVTLEYTAPHTSQHNGVVEHRFFTDGSRMQSMMSEAGWTAEYQSKIVGRSKEYRVENSQRAKQVCRPMSRQISATMARKTVS
jgi:molybdenum cofactor biosynthesis enzyme MoaA